MALEAVEAQTTPQEEPQTVLRDRLAAIRTDLANERTLLAYLRSGFALIAAGVTFINFFAPISVIVLGWALIPVGLAIIAAGVVRFRRMNHRIGIMCPHEGLGSRDG